MSKYLQSGMFKKFFQRGPVSADGLFAWGFRAALACVASLVTLTAGAAEQLHLRGQLDIHDPSMIVKCEDTYWVFGTGRGILSKYSTNLVDWRVGPPVFT